ncbi:TPA: hypothetical protein DEB72_02420, partial [Patescibacteria group bacterium]|nr:hypothetical protein [Patescibacteria group bacterium]
MRQALIAFLLVLGLVIFILPDSGPRVHHRLFTPHFIISPESDHEVSGDFALMENMKRVVMFIEGSWLVNGYPVPYEELSERVWATLSIPIYDPSVIKKKTYGFYYSVSWDGQYVYLELYNVRGELISKAVGYRPFWPQSEQNV